VRPALRVMTVTLLLALAAFGGAVPEAHSDERSKGPVGWDVYNRLDRLAELPTGTRTVQTSSHDRTGGNDDGHFGTYSCPRRVAAGCVIAERKGPGEIEGIWFTRDFGLFDATGALRVELDGRRVIDAGLTKVIVGRLGPPFVFPFVAHSAQSSGGGYVNVPMPFRRSMRVITENNPGYYHVIYRVFSDSRGLPRFDPEHHARSAQAKLRAVASADPKPARHARLRRRHATPVRAGSTTTIARLRGSGVVTGLGLRLRGLSETHASEVLRRARLRIWFDGRRTVEAPLGEFFGSGLGAARVRSLMFAMGPTARDWLHSRWPMPYAGSMRVAIENPTEVPIPTVDVRVRANPGTSWKHRLKSGTVGRFSATSHGPSLTESGRDWSFLAVRGRGKFVGVTQTMRGGDPEYYLEGDESAFIDGSRRPQITGTGTEDFYLGGWYFLTGFRSRTFTLPLNGFPKELTHANGCSLPTCKTAYRLMLGDAVPFRSSLRFGIEHGGRNEIEAVYSSTAYWYDGRPR
jgi:hypothetical protein